MRWPGAAIVLGALLGGCATTPEPEIDLIALYRDAGEAYRDDDLERARTLYARLAEAIPEQAEPWFRLGNIHARERRPDQAVAAYREAVRRDPELYKAWHNLGIVYLRQASDAFTQMALRAPPGSPMGRRGEAYASSLFELLGAAADLPAVGEPPAPEPATPPPAIGPGPGR